MIILFYIIFILLLDFPYTKTVLTDQKIRKRKALHETHDEHHTMKRQTQTNKEVGKNPVEEYFKEKLTDELLSKAHENELIWLVHRLSLKNDRQVDYFLNILYVASDL